MSDDPTTLADAAVAAAEADQALRDASTEGLVAHYQQLVQLANLQEDLLSSLMLQRVNLEKQLEEAGILRAELDEAPYPAHESGYIQNMAKILKSNEMDWVQPTANETYQFAKVIEKYSAWLKSNEAVGEVKVGDAPDWQFPDPSMSPEELDNAIRLMATQMLVEGSTLRHHPSPRGWLLAHLFNALGEVLGDWALDAKGDHPLRPDELAEGMALLVYLALQLGLHEVGVQRMTRELRFVFDQWSSPDARLKEHALIYRLLVWEGHNEDALAALRAAGELDN